MHSHFLPMYFLGKGWSPPYPCHCPESCSESHKEVHQEDIRRLAQSCSLDCCVLKLVDM